MVRLELDWRQVAPRGKTKPTGFNSANPADPLYNWSGFDREVRLARAHGLQVIASVEHAPTWASEVNLHQELYPGSGDLRPDAVEFGRFASAAAKRYSGRFQSLPRIRYWQAWNEPNTNNELLPQLDGGKLVSPDIYRSLVNSFAAAVHAVHRDNLVVAGGLAPFTIDVGRGAAAIGPLRFMRDLLCMSSGPHPRATCKTQVHFDIWSTHPYTSGGPTHHASNPDDVSLGDLGKVRTLLRAAEGAHQIVSSHRVKFWVTEFSWDTNPPDTYAVPIKLHARWVAEALYRMWAAGVSLVSWYLLRDQPWPGAPAQSGLYYRGANVAADRAKLSLAAFRFPFVAFRQAGRIFVWGRTPTSRRATVIVERGASKRWSRLGVLRANRYGIFTARLRAAGSGDLVRARLANGKGVALGFSLTVPPDRFVVPFGGGGGGGGGG